MIPNSVMQMLNKIPNIGNLQNIKTPEDVAQYLLDTGKVNQEQVNRAKQMWSNPQIQQAINSKYK